MSELAGFAMATIFDEAVEPSAIPVTLDTGVHPSFIIYDGVTRGIAVLARCSWHKALLGFKLEPSGGDITVSLQVSLDEVTHAWWLRKYDDAVKEDSYLPRHIAVRCGGQMVGGFTLAGESAQAKVDFALPGSCLKAGGLFMIELEPLEIPSFATPANLNPLLGVQIDAITIECGVHPEPLRLIHCVKHDGAQCVQAAVLTHDEPVRLRMKLQEHPPLASVFRRNRLSKTAGRMLRKAGVIARRVQRRRLVSKTSGDDVHAVIRATAWVPETGDVAASTRLLQDEIVEVLIPPGAGPRVVFVEVSVNQQELARLGYAGKVSLQPLPEP